MAELEQGTPAVAAPTDNDSLSPGFDAGTPEVTPGPEASSGTEEATAIKAELEELRKRVSHGTKTYQELQAIKAERDALNGRLTKWKSAGVDPDEIDRALDAANGGQATRQAAQPDFPKDVMTKAEYQQEQVLSRWNMQKESWLDKNPEHDTEETHDFFDARARRIAAKEIAETGTIISTPKEIFKKALADWNKLQTSIEKRVEKRLTEKRTQVNSQGITDTSHQKVKVDRTETEDKPKTPQERAKSFRERQKQMMRGG